MGVKSLWSLLEPYAERKPLSDLDGKVVCVDLAGWVCESMNICDYQIQPKMYLKNLFFRTCYLLLANINPIFITEGATPELKFKVVAKRNEMQQFMGARPRKEAPAQSQRPKDPKGRTRFNHILKQCQELVACLGIQTIQPPGEAEAYGAHLNALGLIDGVISQDSDCFAYGARRVYRNFSVAKQGTAQSAGGMVDVYDMDRINTFMDIGQDKIIVMALLCGCDYCPEGVEGVGRDGVKKLLSKYSENEIMNVIQAWRYEISKFDRLERKINDPSTCNDCGHMGKLASHTRKGCATCRTTQGCNPVWKEERVTWKNELQIRSKALQQKDFPSKEIIHEFKRKLEPPKSLDLVWKQPNIVKFLKAMGRHLEWNEIYAFQKVFPLLCRWQLKQRPTSISKSPHGFVVPSFIKKKRNPKAIPSYEIIWKDEKNYFRDLFPDEQLETYLVDNDCGVESLWTTIEPVELVAAVYPSLVEEFEAARMAKKKKPKAAAKAKRIVKSPSVRKPTSRRPTKRKPTDSLNNFSDMQSELEAIAVPKTKTASNTRKKKVTEPLIERFLKVHVPAPVEDSILSLPPCDDDEECENIQDLSNLITDIVTRSPIVRKLHGYELMYSDFQEKLSVSPEKNQSLDDIDLMIMRKGARPKLNHKRVSSLRMDLLSSTPNSKCSPSHVPQLDTPDQQSLFFSPACENDLFESSYNALISNLEEEV